MKTGVYKILIILFLFSFTLLGQNEVKDKIYLAVAEDGIPVSFMKPVYITAKAPTAAERRAYRRRLRAYYKLRKKVRKLYPMAKKVAKIINEVNRDLEGVTDPRERKKYLKRLEKDLFEKYEDDIRNLTVYEGKILIKLINRETGSTAYALIEEYKNTRSAVFWQFIAKLFGSDLKLKYDPQKERAIEMIVQQIESGEDSDWVTIAY